MCLLLLLQHLFHGDYLALHVDENVGSPLDFSAHFQVSKVFFTLQAQSVQKLECQPLACQQCWQSKLTDLKLKVKSIPVCKLTVALLEGARSFPALIASPATPLIWIMHFLQLATSPLSHSPGSSVCTSDSKDSLVEYLLHPRCSFWTGLQCGHQITLPLSGIQSLRFQSWNNHLSSGK